MPTDAHINATSDITSDNDTFERIDRFFDTEDPWVRDTMALSLAGTGMSPAFIPVMTFKAKLLFLASLSLSGASTVTMASGEFGDIPLHYKEAMGGGELQLPCSFDHFRTMCKLDSGMAFSKVHGMTPDPDSEVLNEASLLSFAGEKLTCQFRTVKEETIGADLFQPRFQLKIEKTAVFSCPKIDFASNLVGMDFLKERIFSIDTKNKVLSFLPTPLNPHAQGVQKFFIEDSYKQILIPFHIGKENTPALGFFDTGAPISLVSEKFVQRHPELFTEISSNSGNDHQRDLHGNEIKNTLYIMSYASFSHASFSQASPGEFMVYGEYVRGVDLSAVQDAFGNELQFIIGMNWIRNHKWTIDLKNKLFKLEKPPSSPVLK